MKHIPSVYGIIGFAILSVVIATTGVITYNFVAQ